MRLYALIDDEARRQHRLRMAGAGVTFGFSALLGVGGIAALLVHPANQTDATAWTTLGVGFEIVAGLGVGLSLIPLLVLTDIEKLAREYQPIAQDATHTDRLTWGENRLAALAAKERSWRVTAAVLSFVFAPMTIAAGIAIAATQPPGTDDVNRVAWVVLFSALGVADVSLGVVGLIELGPLERLWRTWRIGTNQPVAIRPWLTPLSGGCAGGVGMVF